MHPGCAAAQQFNNKVAVAAFYSIDLHYCHESGGFTTSNCQCYPDAVTVTAAKALIQSGVAGKVIDGYIKEALVFADLNGDGVASAGESGTTTDALGNFVLPGVTGFGQLMVSGGTDIATGSAFEGRMSAPPGSTIINPLTTLIDKIMQHGTANAGNATTPVLISLGLHPSIPLLHFDPTYETNRTDTGTAETGIALATHAAAVKVSILISQTAAFLNGAGLLKDEAAVIDLAYEALAATIADHKGWIDLTSGSVITQVIQDTTILSGADNATLFKVGAMLNDAANTIVHLNQAVVDASNNSTPLPNILSRIAAVQIVSEDIEAMMQSGAQLDNVRDTAANTKGSVLIGAIETAGASVGDVTGDGIPDPLPFSPISTGGGPSSPPSSTVYSYLATDATAFTGTSAIDVLSISTATAWTPLVMTAVILDGGTGTNTLSVQDGSSIAVAIVINFPNLSFDATGVTGTNDVTMSASQNQLFTGTITAAGRKRRKWRKNHHCG